MAIEIMNGENNDQTYDLTIVPDKSDIFVWHTDTNKKVQQSATQKALSNIVRFSPKHWKAPPPPLMDDPNAQFIIYDSNAYLRNHNKIGTEEEHQGTAVKENKAYATILAEKFDEDIFYEEGYAHSSSGAAADVLRHPIFLAWIKLYIEDKPYMVSKANGQYKVLPYKHWNATNKIKLISSVRVLKLAAAEARRDRESACKELHKIKAEQLADKRMTRKKSRGWKEERRCVERVPSEEESRPPLEQLEEKVVLFRPERTGRKTQNLKMLVPKGSRHDETGADSGQGTGLYANPKRQTPLEWALDQFVNLPSCEDSD